MARDAELDRLKSVQDEAFQRKQDAHQAMQKTWERRCNARDAMNRAHDRKQRAYDAQQSSWQNLQRLRDSNGPRIDRLNSLQETAFQNMKRAYENAQSAYDRRDGATAASYAADGRRYKEESQGYVAERRGLVDELRSAKTRHEPYAREFQEAKAEFDRAKREFDAAKAEHERKQAEFKTAKAEYDSTVRAFQARLEIVKSQSKRKRDDKRDIAAKAGVPFQYRDNVYVSTGSDGNTNIYFGGAGEPNGPGHGHYVLDRCGAVTYKRDPFDPHGSQNFKDDEAYINRQKSQGHVGGFGPPTHGFVDDKPVTFALGWGTKQGQTLLADGHLPSETFLRSKRNHDHYGPGNGPHDNGTLRRAYTGPGA